MTVVAPWLVALDIDGTTLHEVGTVSDAVLEQVRRLDAAGHQVMLATGRSTAATIPVLDHLGIKPQYLVCSNGAITLRRDPEAPGGGDTWGVSTSGAGSPSVPGSPSVTRAIRASDSTSV